MNVNDIKIAMTSISQLMTQNKDYLVELDSQNGDGDLGLSMSSGFEAVSEYVNSVEEKDLGKVLFQSSRILNEKAPSSLGTILSFGLMGMGKALKNKTEIDIEELALAMESGLNLIMEKAKSKPGEKTILDSLCPAVQALKVNKDSESEVAFQAASRAAAEGSESTKGMRSVHGRAAYYGDKSIGVLDGGSVVGKLIFEGLAK